MLRPRVLQPLAVVAAVLLAPAVVARLPVAAERAIAAVSTGELRAHIEVLASDELSGRGVGHEGNSKAERYIEQAIRRAGTVPVLETGYLHPVVVYQPALGSGSRVTVNVTSKEQQLVDLSLGDELCPLPESGAGTATARLVFAGHGISAAAQGHDDFARRDVRGAIVMVLGDVPTRLRGTHEEDYSTARKASDAAARGAVGVIVLMPNIEAARALWPEDHSVRAAAYRLYSEVQRSGVPVVAVAERAAESVRRALDTGAQLTATITSGVLVRPVTMHNVLGLVEGRDPPTEMVVIGAHFDHDGIDAAGHIYNGADDNASGTAAVMAIAAAFARAATEGERPRRAVLFALWNGEEKGSLGAEAYVDDPQPRRRIVANINLDMIGRAENVPDPHDPRFIGFGKRSAAEAAQLVHLLGYSYSSDLARIVIAANTETGLRIEQDYDQGAQGLLRRSDNWPFLRRGIPAAFLTTGLHPDYHTPDDDVERLDFGKLERITRLAARAAWLAADGPAPRLIKH